MEDRDKERMIYIYIEKGRKIDKKIDRQIYIEGESQKERESHSHRVSQGERKKDKRKGERNS